MRKKQIYKNRKLRQPDTEIQKPNGRPIYQLFNDRRQKSFG